MYGNIEKEQKQMCAHICTQKQVEVCFGWGTHFYKGYTCSV